MSDGGQCMYCGEIVNNCRCGEEIPRAKEQEVNITSSPICCVHCRWVGVVGDCEPNDDGDLCCPKCERLITEIGRSFKVLDSGWTRIQVPFKPNAWAQVPPGFNDSIIPDKYIFDPDNCREQVNLYWDCWRKLQEDQK